MDEVVADTLNIEARSSRHGSELVIGGASVLLLEVLYIKLAVESFNILAIFIASAAIAMMLLGILKMQQPVYSFTLTPNSLTYRHYYGSWTIPWDNIQRVDIPKITHGIDRKEMSYVGLKLRNSEAFLETLPARLAVRTVSEQQALFLQVLRAEGQHLEHPDEHIFNVSDFKSSSGKIYRGISAMYAHRMMLFRQLLGYDILLPGSAFDREPHEFVRLLLHYLRQQSVSNHE